MLPLGELRGEVPTRVMWGYLRVLQGPRHCPCPGIRRDAPSEPGLTVCIPPQWGHFPMALLALLPGLGSDSRSFIHAFIYFSTYA